MEQEIVTFLKRKLNPNLIYLFGSYTKGNVHPESDVDVAYLSDTVISHYDRFMLAQELASMINKDVDLVDISSVTTVFQIQIIADGKVLYCRDDKKRALFEMKVYKQYAKLNEERKVVLDVIKERGHIYEP